MNAQDSPKDALSLHKDRIFKQGNFNAKPMDVVENQNQFDALFYKIDLEIKYENKEILGEVEGRFSVLSDSLNRVLIDLRENMSVHSVSGAGHQFAHESDFIEIVLDTYYYQNEEFTVIIKYSGAPSSKDYRYFTFDIMPDGSSYAWTLSEPYGAKFWWPCKDTPADKADSVSINIIVPDNQVVGSNGMLKSVDDYIDGKKIFHWFEKYPIATYLVSLVAGEYATFQEYYHYGANDSLLLDYYVFPDYLTASKESFAEMSDYLDALSFYFGPYPFLDEKYGMAQFSWGGGIEHQTLTSIGRVTPAWRYVYVHELGHQWFGDAVTCASWTDIWLNEGFASYSEALYAEWSGFGGSPPGMEAYQAYMLTQYYTQGGTIFVQDTTEFSNIFSKIVYDKGSWVLHMLRHILGDDTFFDVLKSYVSDVRWKYGSVSTENFKLVCEEKSGKNLDAFFDQWLYYPYYPIYKYNWENVPFQNVGHETTVQITQAQPNTIYEMPIDVFIQFQDGQDTTIVVQNYNWYHQYTFQFEKLPIKVELDPEFWILREAYISSEGRYSSEISFRAVYPNPFREQVLVQITSWSQEPPELTVYDINGRKVNNLLVKGRTEQVYFYEWDGQNIQGAPVSSGVYFFKAQSNNGSVQVSKIVKLN